MSEFWEMFGAFRWQDLFDIVINSYIVFRLYILFRGTNAFRILVGIVFLLVLQEVAASVGLILTTWALRGITAAAAIIIVVVFRNEIRSALQVKNLKTFLWGSPQREQKTSIQIITDSVYQMGKQRIGALLVFPGREDLREVIHGGTRWDGMVSMEMLTSIFWPKNPVHDGAAIIRGDRVTEVGTFLPLSQRQDLPKFYGTRHRAAAGLAERTDALVVVVSEERGRVTAAKGDWIKPMGKAEDLQELLRNHLNLDTGEQIQMQRRERIRNGIAIGVSFLIVAGIWFGFTRGRDTIISLDVPIEYAARPSNLEILDTEVNSVELQISGPSALLKSMEPGEVAVKVDLDKAVEGRNVFPITRENVSLPPGVLLNKVDPPTVEVTLDVLAAKWIPVQVHWVGKLPEDRRLAAAATDPEAVKVVGGKKILEEIQTVYTAPVRLDNLRESGTLAIPLILTPASLKLASGSGERISVSYTIKERQKLEPAKE